MAEAFDVGHNPVREALAPCLERLPDGPAHRAPSMPRGMHRLAWYRRLAQRPIDLHQARPTININRRTASAIAKLDS